MASQHIGSELLLQVETDKVCLTIEGKKPSESFIEKDANIKLQCGDSIRRFITFEEAEQKDLPEKIVPCRPLFFEQQPYRVTIRGKGKVSFSHEKEAVQSAVTSVPGTDILCGTINFNNEVGFSDLIVMLDGKEHLRVTIEIFSTKIDYKSDYTKILEEIRDEQYNLLFDFLKKTYRGYKTEIRDNRSNTEFLSILWGIFEEFRRAIDHILRQPHHILEVRHEILPSHKVRRTDGCCLRWLAKHPGWAKARIEKERVRAERMMAIRKQVTYDTAENRFTKYILQDILRRIKNCRESGLALKVQDTDSRQKDKAQAVKRLEQMEKTVDSRLRSSFLADIEAKLPIGGLSLFFSMAPGYRELYRDYLLLRSGLAIEDEQFNISLKDVATLYEYWCFLKLGQLIASMDGWKMESQTIVKIDREGLFFTPFKGEQSKIQYVSGGNKLSLYYNREYSKDTTHTIAQKPDIVLVMGEESYIFDAKYRIDWAAEGTRYKALYDTPGPTEDSINTMHRYRDAIPGIRGAVVLFPYKDEETYTTHNFYESIDKETDGGKAKVNIGGLPFLPGVTTLVKEHLEKLLEEVF